MLSSLYLPRPVFLFPKATLFLFACLVVACFAHIVSAERAEIGVVPIVSEDESPLLPGLPEEVDVWTQCSTLPKFGPTCVALYLIPASMQWGIRIAIKDIIVKQPIGSGDHVCVDDITLLRIIESDPELRKYHEILEELIKHLGEIPADLLKVCVELQDFSATPTEVKGCANLEVRLICVNGKCIQDLNTVLGCFDKPYLLA
mmetsp:Transcript_55157/g.91699  ORF Transcript_55157/g.91699 Transcript_55157/m.91699 type:complete len:202 (-) Transcript_55157:89-694(-)